MISSWLKATVRVFWNSMWVLFTWTITHMQNRVKEYAEALHYPDIFRWGDTILHNTLTEIGKRREKMPPYLEKWCKLLYGIL